MAADQISNEQIDGTEKLILNEKECVELIIPPQLKANEQEKVVLDYEKMTQQHKTAINKKIECGHSGKIVVENDKSRVRLSKLTPKNNKRWSRRETVRFYFLISKIGLNFSQLAQFFNRTATQLKLKYKTELLSHPSLIDKMVYKSQRCSINKVAILLDRFDKDYDLYTSMENAIFSSTNKHCAAEPLKRNLRNLKQVKQKKQEVAKLKKSDSYIIETYTSAENFLYYLNKIKDCINSGIEKDILEDGIDTEKNTNGRKEYTSIEKAYEEWKNHFINKKSDRQIVCSLSNPTYEQNSNEQNYTCAKRDSVNITDLQKYVADRTSYFNIYLKRRNKQIEKTIEKFEKQRSDIVERDTLKQTHTDGLFRRSGKIMKKWLSNEE